ncbi:hypothetical protein MBH78_07815 [Oceanimonas sp. NS1]|nr:hypothetical protein [Oceanimonas sp. NS1]
MTVTSTTTETCCAELLVRLLRDTYGVDTLFGIPGVHTIELYRGLEGSGLRHVTPRHEQGRDLWPMAMPAAPASPVCALSSPARA